MYLSDTFFINSSVISSIVKKEDGAYGQIRSPGAIRVTPDGSSIFVLDGSKRVLQFNASGSHQFTYNVDNIGDITVDAKGTLYALNTREGKVIKCSGGNTNPFCEVTDRKERSRCTRIVVSDDGKDLFISNTRDYKILHYTNGVFKQPFPPQKSDFRTFDGMKINSMGILYVNAKRDYITPLYNGDATLSPGVEIAFRGVEDYDINGYGEMIILNNRSVITVLRIPFLNNE